MSLDDLIRFWLKVQKTETCWIWTAGLDSDGYGGFHLNGLAQKAHRVSWFIEHKVWPELSVLHSCDVRRCVRPDHLFLGTTQDNVLDALSKGRWPTGEDHSSSKVSDAAVAEIRFKVALGLTCEEVGRQYGLGSSQVSRICNFQSRKT